ncbi:MAG: lamin tail domain-containing protein [Planctomycetes bacterium]|nr:lamin tail domain-containing protein [Planctomycetota bacterium]MBI3847845.1 lamin tail domain-containing protein [Planctomycetota bacterium]
MNPTGKGGYSMRKAERLLILAALLPALCSPVQAAKTVRIAAYNIQFLSTDVVNQGDRLPKLKQVIQLLDADVIGLEEVKDRAALELVFPPQDWQLVIDDDSSDLQDLALAVRKPFTVLGVKPTLDADDQNFLFPGAANDSFFPNRRDVLAVEVQVPNESATFYMMVVHQKSRVGGRATTDFRREGGASALVQKLKADFDDKDFFLLGDFNDDPDDRSLNILEQGDPNALGGPNDNTAVFLINLMQPLVAQDRVSEGLGANDIDPVTNKINTIDPQSRKRDNDARGTNQNTGAILFDQILMPGWMQDRYVQGSAKVFDDGVALRGTKDDRASDHLPVYAECVFGSDGPGGGGGGSGDTDIRIASLLPNPNGDDKSHEEVTLRSVGAADLNLTSWKLRDRQSHEFALSGTIAGGATLTIVLKNTALALNNGGDDVSLFDPQGALRHLVTYTAIQAKPGKVVVFP